MKIWMAVLALIICLAGCGTPPAYETVSDAVIQPDIPKAGQVVLELPEDAGTPAMQSDSGDRLYLCDGYSISIQTMASGDLEKTFRSATGYSFEALSPVQTQLDDMRCYACVWTAAGEGQTQAGRIKLIDDGNYHYVVTVLADADRVAQLQPQIQTLMRSVRIMPASFNPNTGS